MLRRLAIQIIFVVLLVGITFLLAELVFWVLVFKKDTVYGQVYEAINNPKNAMPYLSQPYLNYINNPDLQDAEGNKEVNSMGMRYPEEISTSKPQGTYRILFLGGSTTFGDVEDDYEMFPVLIEKYLRDTVAQNLTGIQKIQCLNGGVHGLTSAEILTHYQFKYQYIKPDLIVIHTGFNDAFMYVGLNNALYQPDYHNGRRVYRDVMDLSPLERRLVKSRIFAYYLINTRLGDFLKTTLENNIFFHHTNERIWFKEGNAAITDTNYNAFYNNIKTLLAVAERNNTPVLLVPEVCDSIQMTAQLAAVLPKSLRMHKHFLESMQSKDNVYYTALPDSVFPSDVFLKDDPIHVNATGEKLKAYYIGREIERILTTKQQIITAE